MVDPQSVKYAYKRQSIDGVHDVKKRTRQIMDMAYESRVKDQADQRRRTLKPKFSPGVDAMVNSCNKPGPCYSRKSSNLKGGSPR